MRQCLLLLMCLCCFTLILPAQSSQKELGDREQTQVFLENQFLEHPAFAKMSEIVARQNDGIWALIQEKDNYQFLLDGELLFQLDQTSGTDLTKANLPSFTAQAVGKRDRSMDETFFNYQVFSLDAQAIHNLAQTKRGNDLNFKLELGQHNWVLELEPSDLLADGLKIKVLTENGIRYQDIPQDLYQGTVGGKQEQIVRFNIHEDYLVGALRIGGEEYFLEPVAKEVANGRSDLYVLYRTADVRPNPELTCGVTEAMEHATKPNHEPHVNEKKPDPGCFDVTELALAGAWDMVQKFGTIGAVAGHIFDITALMEVLYDPFQLDYKLVDIVIPGSAAADPWSTSAFMDVLLPDFATWGNTGSNFETHDIGQLWVARDVFRGSVAMPIFTLIGRADGIGVVCTADRYNVCEDFTTNLNGLRSLSAHEIGHLWDGVHGDATFGVTIMSSNIVTNATAFTGANTTNIQNHIDSRVCLVEDCCRLVVDCSNIFDQDLECRSDLPPVDFDLPIITESCGAPVFSALTIIPGDSGCPGDEILITRTYFLQADDDLFQCYQEFTVESTQGPSITCPANFEVSLDANCEFSIPNYSALASASASCSNYSVSVSQVSPAPTTVYNAEANVVVTLRATDDCGRTQDCSFTVFVRDNSSPMITTCDGGTMVFDGEDNQLSSSAINLVADDNCGIASIEYDPEFIYCDQLGENVAVEITVTDINGNASVCNTSVFVDGLPCGWMQAYVGCTGDITYDVANEIFTLESDNCYYAGSFNQDQLTFAKYELCGDGSITAEVSSLATVGWAGVTMRETLAAGSKKIQLMNNGANLARREVRSTTNGSAYPQQFPSFNKKWVRLVRSGSQFIGYISPNGVNWQQVMAANISMADCIQIGLVTTNFNPNFPVTASFSNVVVDPPYMGGGALAAPTTTPQLIPQAEQKEHYAVELFPNPTAGKVTLDLANFQNKDLQLSILNSNGQQQWQRQLNGVEHQREILQLERLPVGVYWLRIQLEDEPAIMRRIVITRP